jgi:16S rRNA U516 pseudouridylate synthase RsuA-like enzyme
MKDLLQKPLMILIATIITLLFLLSLRKTASKSLISQKNVELLEEKIRDVNQQITKEKKELEYTSSEFAKEKIMRNELLLQKPGEYVLQIPLKNQEDTQEIELNQQRPIEAWKQLFSNEK